MKYMNIVTTATMAACLLLSGGCEQTRGNNATTGAILGGLTGAFATSGHTNNGAITLLGTLAGAMITVRIFDISRNWDLRGQRAPLRDRNSDISLPMQHKGWHS